MRRILFIQFALLFLGAMAIDLASNASAETLLSMAKQKCVTIGEKRVCFEDGKSKKSNDDDDDDDDDDKPKKKKKTGNICEGKIVCDPGYVVLDKPNKYGACCEPKEGFPTPAPAPAEKCKFPGEVGTPPNCTCPPGTEFMGYKGCVAPPPPPPPPPPEKPKGDPRDYCSENLNDAAMEVFRSACRSLDVNNLRSATCFAPPAVPKVWSCCCRHLK
jgi:hypothetical protein